MTAAASLCRPSTRSRKPSEHCLARTLRKKSVLLLLLTRGPQNVGRPYIYIYIYMCVCYNIDRNVLAIYAWKHVLLASKCSNCFETVFHRWCSRFMVLAAQIVTWSSLLSASFGQRGSWNGLGLCRAEDPESAQVQLFCVLTCTSKLNCLRKDSERVSCISALRSSKIQQ